MTLCACPTILLRTCAWLWTSINTFIFYVCINIYIWNVLGKLLLILANHKSDSTTDATAGTYDATTAMHISVRMTIGIIFGFLHVHLCTNEYPYYFWFSSYTSLYEWASIIFLIFIMHISVRMTIHIIFDFSHTLSVRINIHIIFDFRHAHICTNDYPYYFWFSSCTTLYENRRHCWHLWHHNHHHWSHHSCLI